MAAESVVRRMPLASDPRIRASDADRDRTAALLREHHAAGRLTAEEFNERLKDPNFAKNPRARLQFLYERSRYFLDQKVGIYPVGRIIDARQLP